MGDLQTTPAAAAAVVQANTTAASTDNLIQRRIWRMVAAVVCGLAPRCRESHDLEIGGLQATRPRETALLPGPSTRISVSSVSGLVTEERTRARGTGGRAHPRLNGWPVS